MDINLLYVTFPSEEEALKMANTLVKANLIICANLQSPITSTYKWEGKIETAKEWIQIFKVIPSKVMEVEKHISDNHSYDAPAILKINTQSLNAGYSRWADQQ